MKFGQHILWWLFVICVPIFLTTATLRWAVSEIRLYQYGFDKYQISKVTGIDKEELEKVARQLIDYFNLRAETAQIAVSKEGKELNLFNDRELIHLQDIRNLIQLDYKVQLGAASFLILYSVVFLPWQRRLWQNLVKGIIWGCGITLAFVIALGLASLFAFSPLFYWWHVITFPNEYWILDPSKDYLIQMFPEDFFYKAALFVFGAIALEALLIGGLTYGLGWKKAKLQVASATTGSTTRSAGA